MEQVNINVTKIEKEVTINATPNVTQIIVTTQSGGGGGIPEAPNNSNAYLRSALNWVIGYTKTAIDNLLALKQNILIAGDNITIDNTDPLNPIISSTGGGGGTTPTLQEVTDEGTNTTNTISVYNNDDSSATSLTSQGVDFINPSGATGVSLRAGTQTGNLGEVLIPDAGETPKTIAFQEWVTSLGYWVSVGANNLVAGISKLYNAIGTETDGGITPNAVKQGLDLKANLTQVGNLLREEFTFTSSQTFTLSNNYGQVYSVEVQGQGALSTSQYTLVSPNQITINDTLDSGDYIVVIYSNAIAGIQPYYSQAEVDALLNLKQNNLGYTPENVANKSTNIITDQASDIKYPTVKSVFDWVIVLGYQTALQVSTAISSALATFKTANFLDATSSIQTQLNNKQNNFYSLKVTTPSAYVTGTLSETEVLRVEIPANTFSANDILKIPLATFIKVGTNGTYLFRIKLTTSTTMPTGATGTVAISPTIGATNLYANLQRSFILNGGNLKATLFFFGILTDYTSIGASISSVAFDPTVTQYLYVSVTLSNIADQVRLEGLQLTNY